MPGWRYQSWSRTVAVTLVATLFDFWPLTQGATHPPPGLRSASAVTGRCRDRHHTPLRVLHATLGGLDPVEILVRVAVSADLRYLFGEPHDGSPTVGRLGSTAPRYDVDGHRRGTGHCDGTPSMRTALHSIARRYAACGGASPAYELEIWGRERDARHHFFRSWWCLPIFFEFWPLKRQVTTMKDGR